MADRTGMVLVGSTVAICVGILAFAAWRLIAAVLPTPVSSSDPVSEKPTTPSPTVTPTQLFVSGRDRVVSAACVGMEPREVCRIVAGKCFDGSVPEFERAMGSCSETREQCFSDAGDVSAENFQLCWMRNAPQYLRAKGE